MPQPVARKFASPDDLIRKTGARRDELTVLAEIGALSAFGYDRRAALWQIEKAVRPEGELFELQIEGLQDDGTIRTEDQDDWTEGRRRIRAICRSFVNLSICNLNRN